MSDQTMTVESVRRRGIAMRQFCDRVRERGGVAIVEETEDLPALRATGDSLYAGLDSKPSVSGGQAVWFAHSFEVPGRMMKRRHVQRRAR